MATKKLKMTNGEIVTHVEALVRQSAGLGEGKLSSERVNIQRYYDGTLPAPLSAGDSKYVSQDVYDGVEAMKSQLLEVFAGDQTPITFAPQGPEDDDMATQASEYCSYALFRQNGGYAILRDVIDDGLKFRVGIAQVWWDENYEDDETKVEDISYEEFETILMQDPEIELTDLELDGDTQTVVSATMAKRIDTSQVRIELCPPEEFCISKGARSAESASLVARRRPVNADELKRMGVPEKLLKTLRDDRDFWRSTSMENQERHRETDDVGGRDDDRGDDDTNREVDVTEAYCRMDLDGRPALWRVLTAGKKLLLKSKVKRLPFVFFVPLPRPHSFWGSNYAKKLIPTQNARTLLTRSIIVHTLITNNPRTGVVKGGLVNPKELTENRIGGIVNLSRPDALVPITQTGLNPFVFQTLQLLDDDKEETTGISKLSQGLSKDAVSKQNSADMVQDMVGNSRTRQRVTARNFAEGFLKALYLEIYRLIIENEKAERIIEIAGAWKPIDPSTWPDRKDVLAEVTVAYGEKDAEVKRWMAVDAYLATDPRFAQQYTAEQRYAVVLKALRAGGIRNVDAIFLNPKNAQPPPPDEALQAELAEKAARTKQYDSQAQATVGKLELDRTKIQQDGVARQAEMQHEIRMAELKERELVLKMQAEREKMETKRELFLLELEAAKNATKTTGVLSPDA